MPGLKIPVILTCVDCGKIVKRKTPSRPTASMPRVQACASYAHFVLRGVQGMWCAISSKRGKQVSLVC